MSARGKNNLEFDASEPAFLRRLRQQARGNVEDPDRQINPVALPKKPNAADPKDDGPVYVIEGSDLNVSKEDYHALVKEKGGHIDGPEDSKSRHVDTTKDMKRTEKSEDNNRVQQKVANAGVLTKKRKAVKVVDLDEPNREDLQPKASKKSKRKGNTIKLSFGGVDDNDDG
jgi:hypothetical protein